MAYICLFLLAALTMAFCAQADLGSQIELKQVDVNNFPLLDKLGADSDSFIKTDELDVLVSFASRANITMDDVVVTAELTHLMSNQELYTAKSLSLNCL